MAKTAPPRRWRGRDGKNRATPPMAGTLTTFIAGPLAVIDHDHALY